MLKSKKDIKNAIQERKKELNSYEDQGCYNAAWCAGYIHAMKEILVSLCNFYESQQLSYAIDDTKDRLREFFLDDVCMKYDECDDVCMKYDECEKRVQQAVENGTVEKIAIRFLRNHRSDVAENDQYYSIIRDMFPDESDDEDEDD